MVFQNNPHKLSKSHTFSYKGHLLENVHSYKYLGCVFNSNGNLTSWSLDLANKARKVLFAIKSYTSEFGNLPVKVSCRPNLFNTLVKPILTYSQEICFMDSYIKLFRAQGRAKSKNSDMDLFSFIDKTPLEKVQLDFIKYTLGTRKNASNIAVRAELGIIPIESSIKTHTILYLSRLNNEKLNPLLREAFDLAKSLDSNGIFSWFTYASNIVTESKIDKL